MDNEQFFRLCWIALKNSRPRLRKLMDDIEWDIAGRPQVREQIKPQESEAGDGKRPEFTAV